MILHAPTQVAEHLEEARILLAGGTDGQQLYSRWFHRETGEVAEWPASGRYRGAILDAARFERGWRVVGTAHGLAGAVMARRGGRDRVVAPPEMAPEDPRDLSPAAGARLLVFPLAAGEAGGFWHIWSAGWQAAMPERFLRLYCRVGPERALDLVSRVAAVAPPRSTWAMKVLCGAHDAGRRDGALLYLPTHARIDSGWVRRLVRQLGTICDGEMPPFVGQIAPGVGMAPDPGGGRSFGEAVSAAVASAAPHAADAQRFAETALAAVRALHGMDLVRLGRDVDGA